MIHIGGFQAAEMETSLAWEKDGLRFFVWFVFFLKKNF